MKGSRTLLAWTHGGARISSDIYFTAAAYRVVRAGAPSRNFGTTFQLWQEIPVKLSNAPRFDSLDLNEKTQKALAQDFGFQEMSAVQAAVLSNLKDRDLLVRAKTGTGKTLAFMVAALEIALKDPSNFGPDRTPILVLSPTRELALQIQAETQKLVAHHRLSVGLAVGGPGRARAVDRLIRSRTDILIGTAGRVNDYLSSEPLIRSKLQKNRVLVFDEADTLMDMGFKQDMEKIVKYLPKDRTTFMFSATFSDNIRTIGARTLRPGYADIDTVPANEVDTHMKIKQSYVVAPFKSHHYLMHQMITKHQEAVPDCKIVVFFNTTKQVSFNAQVFKNMTKLSVMEIHSQLTQPQRIRISDRFRKSRGSILFTSDVSARGVDYPGVTLVLQVGIPSSREQYIHRIGRTGRAGKDGEAVFLLTPYENKYLELIDKLPIRKDLRFVVSQSVEAKKVQEDIEKTVKSIDAGERAAVWSSLLGFQLGNVNLTKMRKETVAEMLDGFAQGFLLLAKTPAVGSKLAQTLGLRGVPGFTIRDEGGFGNTPSFGHREHRDRPSYSGKATPFGNRFSTGPSSDRFGDRSFSPSRGGKRRF